MMWSKCDLHSSIWWRVFQQQSQSHECLWGTLSLCVCVRTCEGELQCAIMFPISCQTIFHCADWLSSLVIFLLLFYCWWWCNIHNWHGIKEMIQMCVLVFSHMWKLSLTTYIHIQTCHPYQHNFYSLMYINTCTQTLINTNLYHCYMHR